MEIPTAEEPAGNDRDLGTGRRRQGGGKQTRDTAVDVDTQCGAQIRVAEAIRWWMWESSRWAELRNRRGGGEWFQEIGLQILTAMYGGGW